MEFFKYLFIFCLFALIGWVLELCYRGFMTKKFVNPGFMSGCVVPIYGVGAVIMTIICNLFSSIESNYKIIFIFILSIILLSILEYISGLILFKCFYLRLWDYSNYKYNLNGFICLFFSMIWGLLSLIFYLFIYPWINQVALDFVNNSLGLFLLGIYMGIFIIDLCASIQLSTRVNKYAKSLKEVINIEKLKLDIRKKETKRKFLNAVYPYVLTNSYIKDRIKELKERDRNEK